LRAVRRLTPILTGLHRYDRSLSLRGHPPGQTLEVPILAYLIETGDARLLYDVGCDYRKIADPVRRAAHYHAATFPAPDMRSEERLPSLLASVGLGPLDLDAIVLGHLHFDHAGGLADFAGVELHCHPDEVTAARANADGAYFAADLAGDHRWRLDREERTLCPGVRLVDSPGHTAGHRSLWVELDRGPVLLAGDAADLQENLDREVAPGILWQDREDLALASIRRLKALAGEGAELWPNHDLGHWRRLRQRGWPVLAAAGRGN
jgi:N-acyl homoserine lactone hydrolase